jgi:hypothetical protein
LYDTFSYAATSAFLEGVLNYNKQCAWPPQVHRMLPGPAGKLQALQAAGRLESATPEALGLSSGGGDEVRMSVQAWQST